ncbi:MAG: hypothetical protein ACYCXB_05230 [Candidatus Humimicrobiaceae bacterium]
MNQKIFKTEFNIFRQSKGSIAIIVLIIGIAIVLAVGALSAYMIKDIKFTQLDEQKLKALNIAEAGISNMSLNIIKYLKDNEPLPPQNIPYPGNVTSNGVVVGTYIVTYTKTESGAALMPTYTITSTGTENSGQQRTVRVTVVILSQYDLIFSFDSINGDGRMESRSEIIGPFMTNGNIDLRGTGGLYEGNPLIINGYLFPGGNSHIGTTAVPVDLYLGENSKTFNPPLTSDYNYDNIHINNFYNKKFNFQSISVDSYINNIGQNDAAIVPGNVDLVISYDGKNGKISPEPSTFNTPSNYIKFDENGILQIKGNILVSGNIEIGIIHDNKQKPIQYFFPDPEKKGYLISKRSINLNSSLIPYNFSPFVFSPDKVIGLISMVNIDFTGMGPSQIGNDDIPSAVVFGICNNIIEIPINKYIRGNMIGRQLNIGENSTLKFESGMILPNGFPPPDYFLLFQKWEEIPNS